MRRMRTRRGGKLELVLLLRVCPARCF